MYEFEIQWNNTYLEIFCYTVKAFILAGLKFGGFEYRAIWQDFILALRRSFKIVI